jgi:hypothetical protein
MSPSVLRTGYVRALAPLAAGLLLPSLLAAQGALPDSQLVRALTYRNIGPASMSGRITDIAVVEAPRSVRGGRLGTTLYVSVATGGIWKTTNAGLTWAPMSDAIGVGSMGAVAAAAPPPAEPPSARAARAALAVHSEFSPAAADALVAEASRVRGCRGQRHLPPRMKETRQLCGPPLFPLFLCSAAFFRATPQSPPAPAPAPRARPGWARRTPSRRRRSRPWAGSRTRWGSCWPWRRRPPRRRARR